MSTIYRGDRLVQLEIKTAGLSLDKSTMLLCVGAEKQSSHTGRPQIVLRVVAGKNVLLLHVPDNFPGDEERYKVLRKELSTKMAVPIRVPSVTVSPYSHPAANGAQVYGLKLTCASFRLLDEPEEGEAQLNDFGSLPEYIPLSPIC